MSGEPIKDYSKLCIHTITTKPWPLEQAVDRYAEAGVSGITVWRDALEKLQPFQAGERIRKAGMEVVSLCRGGFFPSPSAAEREKSINQNIEIVEEAAELGAPLVVLVCGSSPDQPLSTSREQIRAGIEAVLPAAEKLGVKLGVEALHPMYADTRSAINTLAQANDVCDDLRSPFVGVVVDVYHLWWDPNLEREIRRSSEEGRLFAFHICDWKSPTEDLLNDRGLMGEGCIPIRHIRGWMETGGFDGFNEVEIFSNRWWSQDQSVFLKKILEAYLEHS